MCVCMFLCVVFFFVDARNEAPVTQVMFVCVCVFVMCVCVCVCAGYVCMHLSCGCMSGAGPVDNEMKEILLFGLRYLCYAFICVGIVHLCV